MILSNVECSFYRGIPYYALSYIWGPPEKTRSITCNGKDIDIIPSLEAALLHLTNPFFRRVFWVDQLCINQLEDEERYQQVALMGEIYGTAGCVILWLGLADALISAWKLLGSMREPSRRTTLRVRIFRNEFWHSH